MAVKRKATKKVAKKTAKKAPVKKLTAIRDPYSKSQFIGQIADSVELPKKKVAEVVEVLGDLVNRHVKKGGAGQFTLPGLLKIIVKRKPAVKARKGINPFTGEEVMFKAKPAHNVVKIRALKKLKDMVS